MYKGGLSNFCICFYSFILVCSVRRSLPYFTVMLTTQSLFQELITGGSCFWAQECCFSYQLLNSAPILCSIISVASQLEYVLLFSF